MKPLNPYKAVILRAEFDGFVQMASKPLPLITGAMTEAEVNQFILYNATRIAHLTQAFCLATILQLPKELEQIRESIKTINDVMLDIMAKYAMDLRPEYEA